MKREEIFAYAKDKYGVVPDYPWARTPNCAILRHTKSRKWFAAILDIGRDKLGLPGDEIVDALLLKCDPLLIGTLIDGKEVLRGYHMNKEHWITVVLDSTVTREKAFGLLDISFDLTKVDK